MGRRRRREEEEGEKQLISSDIELPGIVFYLSFHQFKEGREGERGEEGGEKDAQHQTSETARGQQLSGETHPPNISLHTNTHNSVPVSSSVCKKAQVQGVWDNSNC